MLIDTHCHLDFEIYEEDLQTVLGNAKNKGVEKIIIPSVEPSSWQKILNLVNSYENLYMAIGVHPSDAEKFNENEVEEKLINLIKTSNKIVAVGEIGLDYHEEIFDKEKQKTVFEKQIQIANLFSLPIVVHSRDAHKDTFDLLKKYESKKVVLHCFSGSLEFAQMCIKEGWNISIGGVVTFKNASKVKQVASNIPLENLMLETDCPFLSPTPHRGERNEPAYVSFVAKEIADLRNISYDKVAEITSKNAIEFFRLF